MDPTWSQPTSSWGYNQSPPIFGRGSRGGRGGQGRGGFHHAWPADEAQPQGSEDNQRDIGGRGGRGRGEQ